MFFDGFGISDFFKLFFTAVESPQADGLEKGKKENQQTNRESKEEAKKELQELREKREKSNVKQKKRSMY